MKITLIAVGKTSDTRMQALIDEYRQRLTHYIPFEIEIIPELRNTKSLNEAQQKTQEGEEILRRISRSTELILMDEHGREFRSIEYAEWLQKKMSGGRDIAMVIGGPYGFSEAVYARANGKIALSRMTFSHQMVRLFAVEQLYRAMTILKGEPYHHE